MQFYRDYCNRIIRAVEEMIVTDKEGNAIETDRGFDLWADRVQDVKNTSKGLIFFCGNGASATMAEHMSHDWFKNAEVNTSTCAETAQLTAIANDIGYEEVFSYKVKQILSNEDMLVGISSSGDSPNIVKAIDSANRIGAFTISISAKDSNNRIRQMGDLNFYVPLGKYGEAESAHALLLHVALDYFLDKYMAGRL